MGKNVSSTGGAPLFNIEGRPAEHDAVISRQGQFTRILRSQKCPNIKSGHSDIFCNICNGKGYIYSYQKDIKVVDESSTFGDICPNVVEPFFNPITKVNYVSALSSDEQFTLGEIRVLDHNDSEIYLDPNQPLLPGQQIRVGYCFSHWEEKTETFKGNGKYAIKVPGTRFDDDLETQFIPNYHEFFSDIVVVNECNYKVKSFYKQWIVFDEDSVSVPPGPNDDITITYQSSKPHIVAAINISQQFLRDNQWLNNTEVGDIIVVAPSYVDIGEGDRVTFQSTVQRRSDLMVRTDTEAEELTEFDVEEVIGLAVDEDGERYKINVDFELDNFNFIRWISGGNSPAVGKRYSITYHYFPTFIAFKEIPVYIGHENKRWPRVFSANRYSRIFKKQREDIINTEEQEVGSGGSDDNKYGFKDVDL